MKSGNKVRFNKTLLESIAPPEKGRATYRDSILPGLQLRVTRTGHKSFVVFKKMKGRPIRITLGTFPPVTVEQARKLSLKILNEISEGRDPNEAIRAERAEFITLSILFDHYLNDHIRARDKSEINPQSYYRSYLEKWGRRKLTQITKGDVRAYHNRIARDVSHVTANRVLSLLKAMYNRAIAWEMFNGENPTDGITKFPEKSRERFLHSDELPRFFRALREEPNETARDYFLISLLTGARRSNVLAMRWDEINLVRGTWTIPKTKTGDPHTVPLVVEAIRILSTRFENRRSDFVFPGRGKSGHLVEPKRAWTRVLERAGIKDLWIHDLRRSLGSWQAATGANLSIIGKTLAHKNVSTTAIYARLDLDPVRQAMERATGAMIAAGNGGE